MFNIFEVTSSDVIFFSYIYFIFNVKIGHGRHFSAKVLLVSTRSGSPVSGGALEHHLYNIHKYIIYTYVCVHFISYIRLYRYHAGVWNTEGCRHGCRGVGFKGLVRRVMMRSRPKWCLRRRPFRDAGHRSAPAVIGTT